MISLKTIRCTGTFGLRTCSRCQAIASPSRSSSVASNSSLAASSFLLQLRDFGPLVGRHHVDRGEITVDVHRESVPGLVLVLLRRFGPLPGRSANVADTRVDLVARAQVALNRLALAGDSTITSRYPALVTVAPSSSVHRNQCFGPARVGAGPRSAYARQPRLAQRSQRGDKSLSMRSRTPHQPKPGHPQGPRPTPRNTVPAVAQSVYRAGLRRAATRPDCPATPQRESPPAG